MICIGGFRSVSLQNFSRKSLNYGKKGSSRKLLPGMNTHNRNFVWGSSGYYSFIDGTI